MTALSDQVFVFTSETLEQALEDWVAAQIAAYPHQEERIRITALAMRDFFASPQIEQHKMTLGGKRRG